MSHNSGIFTSEKDWKVDVCAECHKEWMVVAVSHLRQRKLDKVDTSSTLKGGEIYIWDKCSEKLTSYTKIIERIILHEETEDLRAKKNC